MGGLGARGWGGSCLPAYILQQSVVSTYSSLCSGLDIGPGPHVLVLLLHPAQLGIAVLVSHALHHVEGEGADLLDGVDGNLVLKSTVPSLFQEVIVHFTRAKEDLKVFYNCSLEKLLLTYCLGIISFELN